MRSNRILYALAFVVALAFFLWTGSMFALAIACFLAFLASILAIGVFVARSSIEVDIDVPGSAMVGEESFLTLRLRKGLPISTAVLIFEIASFSVPFNSNEVWRAAVAMNTRSCKESLVPFSANRYGRCDVVVERCWCEDPLGLFKVRFPWTKRKSCVVYPETLALAIDIKHVPLSRAFGDTYDDSRSGSDVDEVFDVREFQAGDHLASVHWKLTSRFDAMMSRQFSRPVDFDLIVVSLGSLEDGEGRKLSSSLLNGAASVGGAVSSDLLRQGFPHNYAVPVNEELVNIMVDSLDTMDAASELLLESPLPENHAKAVACLLSSAIAARFTKCILITPVFDEPLWAQLSTEIDLSVVLVADEAGAGEVSGDYDLVVVDMGDASGRERSITL